jgi:hypothetical protein
MQWAARLLSGEDLLQRFKRQATPSEQSCSHVLLAKRFGAHFCSKKGGERCFYFWQLF